MQEVRSSAEFLLNQGVGIFFGVVCLLMLVWHVRATEKKLADLLRERKSDRDDTLKLMGRLDANLVRAETFEGFAQRAVADVMSRQIPKRRAIDQLLETALHRDAEQRARENPRTLDDEG